MKGTKDKYDNGRHRGSDSVLAERIMLGVNDPVFRISGFVYNFIFSHNGNRVCPNLI